MDGIYFLGIHHDVWLNGSTAFLAFSSVIALPVALWFRKVNRQHANGLFTLLFGFAIFGMAFQMLEIGPRRMTQTLGAFILAAGTTVLSAMHYYRAFKEYRAKKSNDRRN